MNVKNTVTEKIRDGELNEFSCKGSVKGICCKKHFLHRCTSANPTASSRMQGLRMSRWYTPSVVYGVGTAGRYRMIERGGYYVVFYLLVRNQYSIYTL